MKKILSAMIFFAICFFVFADDASQFFLPRPFGNVKSYTETNFENSLRAFYKNLYSKMREVAGATDLTDGIYIDAICEHLKTVYGTNDEMPSDIIVAERLEKYPLYKKINFCKLILVGLENGLLEKGEKAQIDEIITIEHIMPKTLTNKWEQEIGAEYARVHSEYLHTLGNLTLTGHNSEIGNKPFVEKKEILQEKGRFNRLNKDILQENEWNEDKIKNRVQRLTQRFLEVFSVPDNLAKPTPLTVQDNTVDMLRAGRNLKQLYEKAPKELKMIFDSIKEYAVSLGENVCEEIRKHYVVFRNNRFIFATIQISSEKIVMNFKLNPAKYSCTGNLRDVTNIGHLGVGPLELTVCSQENVPFAKELLEKAYHEN